MKKKEQTAEIPELTKYFDKENYSTIVVGKEEEQEESVKDKIAGVMQLLSSKETKELKHDTLKILKEQNGLDLLLKAINKAKNPLIKQNLVAACWESGLDCSNHLSYFVEIALLGDLNMCIEAMTVVEEMPGPFNAEELKTNITKVEEGMKTFGKEDKGALLDQLLNILQTFAQV